MNHKLKKNINDDAKEVKEDGEVVAATTEEEEEEEKEEEEEDERGEVRESANSFRGRPSSCIFVASLAATLTDDELCISVTENFKKFGELARVKVLRDPSNRPYAFVQYTNDKDAKKALKKAQGTSLNGRLLRCEPAKVNRTLFITHPIKKISSIDIQRLCEKFGELELVVPNRENNQYIKRYSYPLSNSNSWFVQFAYRDDAIRAFANFRGDNYGSNNTHHHNQNNQNNNHINLNSLGTPSFKTSDGYEDNDSNENLNNFWEVDWVQNISVPKHFNLLIKNDKETPTNVKVKNILLKSKDSKIDLTTTSSIRKNKYTARSQYSSENDNGEIIYNSETDSEGFVEYDIDNSSTKLINELSLEDKDQHPILTRDGNFYSDEKINCDTNTSNDIKHGEDEEVSDEDSVDEDEDDYYGNTTDDSDSVRIDKKSIFVGQLDPGSNKENLTDRFSTHGRILDLNLIVKPTNIFAFITFDTEAAAAAALERENHAIFLNKTMHVQYKEIGGLHRKKSRFNKNFGNSFLDNSKTFTGPQFNLAPPPINIYRKRNSMDYEPANMYNYMSPLPPMPIPPNCQYPTMTDYEMNNYIPYSKNSNYSFRRKSFPVRTNNSTANHSNSYPRYVVSPNNYNFKNDYASNTISTNTCMSNTTGDLVSDKTDSIENSIVTSKDNDSIEGLVNLQNKGVSNEKSNIKNKVDELTDSKSDINITEVSPTSRNAELNNKKKFYRRNSFYHQPIKPYYFPQYYYHPMNYPVGPNIASQTANSSYMMVYPFPPPPPSSTMMNSSMSMGRMSSNFQGSPPLASEHRYNAADAESFSNPNKSYELDY
ncbi:hypothetical protein TPHA_0F00350 [Tetrapisispora phaffii CBS 4417]|uniref:RRM domain-containing protein n=1 Tax=Tetrapisispora phaffii (strain ATCC 24235 / CBS 4417 / NBRC 1672 / NRRL Y-8282 / UCD 70-5) TaxID=1071381 RepID=G8BUU0_TETPH|nr:hypothetical protein TPHA_0F00350 [Tetrapisispora phaffii CBS 4417]CCE63522.1 hypothetical protein TPHA_0F00350 [Tetrapisispora phaffii CBS 4417]